MGMAAAFGLFWSMKQKKLFPTVITLGMSVGIVLVFFPHEAIETSGFYLYMAFVALAFIYGLTVKNRSILTKIVISVMSASIFAYWLWAFNHWHGNALLLPILTLLTGLVTIITKVKLKNELGFITILAVDAIAIIIENWMKANF